VAHQLCAEAENEAKAAAQAAKDAEEAAKAGNKPVWEVVETWLKSRPGGRVTPRKVNTPKLVGTQGNPVIA